MKMAMTTAMVSCCSSISSTCALVRPVMSSGSSDSASTNGSGRGGGASSQFGSTLVAEPSPSPSPSVQRSKSTQHSVTVVDRQRGVTHQFDVPEDQYILHTGEDQDITLPFSCRHGCCTTCAVRVKSGKLHQPEALGISAELKEKGYGLLCVGYALSDLEVETQDEDEVYWLQFGQYFARGPIEKDEYALELAMADE